MSNVSFSCNSSDSVASDGTSVQGVTSILNDTKSRDVAKNMVERFENLHLGSARVPPSQDSAPVNGNLGMPGENSDNSQKKFEDPGLFIRRQNAIVQVFTREEKREKKNREQPGEHHSDNSQNPLVGNEPVALILQEYAHGEISNSDKKKADSVTVYNRAGVPPVEPQQGQIARLKTSCLNLFQRCFGRAPR